jgi:hypothetical protein
MGNIKVEVYNVLFIIIFVCLFVCFMFFYLINGNHLKMQCKIQIKIKYKNSQPKKRLVQLKVSYVYLGPWNKNKL